MAFNTAISDAFTGTKYGDNEKDFHVITTDDPWMIEIGLGTFTTGVFQEWWNYRLGDGSYPNRNLIGLDDKSNLSVAELFFGPDGDDGSHFTGWRANTKKYTEYKNVHSDTLSNWSFKDKDGANPYSASDLDLSTYKKYKTVADLGAGVAVGYTDDAISSYRDGVFNIIEINNQIRLKRSVTRDESTWNDKTLQARSEFIRDIKSSLEKCVTWTNEIPFRFNVNSVTQVDKPAQVTFKMYLFDEQNPRQNARKAAMSEFTIVGSPIDALGVSYNNGSRVDGEYENASEGSTTGKVGGKLKATYNEFTEEWESGTTQIVARILTDMEACSHPNVDAIFNAKVSELIESTNSNYTAPSTGLAMPISMQNKNPLQWAPNYKDAKGCRQDNKKKTVPIVNIANRSWAKGDLAILNQINGVWIPSAFGNPTESDTATSVQGGWDFTYLMTNTEYFFRDVSNAGDEDTFKQFSYSDYETSFWNLYYGYIGADVVIPKSSGNACGYYQVTSWDFMGPSIGGNRAGGNAIAQTQFAIRVDETKIDQEGKGAVGTHSAPFFGCVFPDGYNAEAKYAKYKKLPENNIAIGATDSNGGNFFSSPLTTTNLFADTNSNVGEGTVDGQGMFAAGNSNLKHLPADIALNASPSGVNGRPISNINYMADKLSITSQTRASGLHDGCNYYFNSVPSSSPYDWMYVDDEYDDNHTSLFDLAPNNPNKIEFRPLKAEVYAAFEHVSANTTGVAAGARGEFGARAWRMVNDAESPISIKVLDRNSGLEKQVDVNLYDSPSKRSLRYGVNDSYHIKASFRNSSFRSSSSARFPTNYWDSPWNSNRAAAAVGVIGAVCTVKANSTIQFNAEVYMGMSSTFAGSTFYPSWGGGSNDYKDMHTTQLYARIFTSWPRELTIYDHRFFAVHHFNYGAGKANEAVVQEWYSNGSLNSDYTGDVAVGEYPNGIYQVDKASTDVDIRVPTWKKHDGSGPYYTNAVNDKTNVDVGTLIFSEAPLRNNDDWNIPDGEGRKRRGKLLPYNYFKTTIGLPESLSIIFATAGTSTTAKDADIMIVNRGEDYTDGDAFTTSGGSGSEVTLTALTSGGAIIGFTVVDQGYGFSVDDFMNSAAKLDGKTTSNIEIVAKNSSGTGFKGYLVRGHVISSQILTDDAPKEAIAGPIQLTPNPPVSETSGGANDQVLNTSRSQTLSIENFSNNKLYDIYFHFHNDISHTFADSSFGGSIPPAHEQMVRLEMTLV